MSYEKIDNDNGNGSRHEYDRFAQRIDNTIKEARILTDKMVEEVNLNNWQREKAKKEVLGEGLPIYDCINFACIFFLP